MGRLTMPVDDPRIHWSALRGPGPVEGVTAAIAHGTRLSAALYRLDPGAVVPEHAHDNEEFGQVIRGSLELRCPDSTMVLEAGDAFLLSGGVPHGARAGAEGCELLECYAPPRAATPPSTVEQT
jgi:quercetin dioxygenase-like cupin family protein